MAKNRTLTRLKVGPLLGLESEDRYTVCFVTDASVETTTVTIDGAGEYCADVVDTVPAGKFWRAEITITPPPDESCSVAYSVQAGDTIAQDIHDRSTWNFFVPASGESPRIAYASCNGFSSGELATKTDQPYVLWERMRKRHEEDPFALLLMGGDQLYADEIWSKVNELRKWRELNREDRRRRSASKLMREQIDRFYSDLYASRWSDEHMSLMLASVPSVMMWDDHDIFDGWGSYPDDLQQWPVYQAIFETASRYFELFQIRSSSNASLLREYWQLSAK